MTRATRMLIALVTVACVLIGAPDLAQANTTAPDPNKIGGAALSPTDDPAVSSNRTQTRRNILIALKAPNTSWQATIDTAPGINFREITVADLKAMFPTKVCNTTRVAEGLPRLNQEMRNGRITTPARQAAFLATIAYESCFDYALNEAGVYATYRGRGYIQLTGQYNYSAAGTSLGVNLAGNPGLAASVQWSAPVARWYWTIHRPKSNSAADNFDMGLISRYIGYAPSSSADAARCQAFKRAYQYLSGKTAPASTICYRH